MLNCYKVIYGHPDTYRSLRLPPGCGVDRMNRDLGLAVEVMDLPSGMEGLSATAQLSAPQPQYGYLGGLHAVLVGETQLDAEEWWQVVSPFLSYFEREMNRLQGMKAFSEHSRALINHHPLADSGIPCSDLTFFP